MVLLCAEKAGWRPPELNQLEAGLGVDAYLEITMEVTALWLQNSLLLGSERNCPYSFVRYRFFDLGWF